MSIPRPQDWTIDDALFDHALCCDRKGRSVRWRDIAAEYLGAIIGIGLIVAGLVCFKYVHQLELAKDLCETAVIAGVVTLTVDPFLKKRLIKEASKDIFHHMLGFDLQDDIRDSLNEHLKNTSSYREDLVLEVHVAPLGGDKALVTISQWSTVVAMKHCTYCQVLNFEDSEQGKILEVSITGNRDSGKDYEKRNVVPDKDTPEPWVQTWRGPEISLRKNERLKTYARFSVIRSNVDFFTMNFSAPVVKPRVHILDSDNFTVIASDTRKTGNTYLYERVFLPADHIQIRWKPKD